MKKQVLSTIMALYLFLLPMAVAATEDGGNEGGSVVAEHVSHCVCGETHCNVGDHTTESLITDWQGVSALSEITESGNYYLKSDVTLSEYWQKVEKDINVVLCLNGFTITVQNYDPDDFIRVNGGTLTLTDCKGGSSICGIYPSGEGKVVRMIGSESVINMYAITIKNIRVGRSGSYHGGGVRNTGVFNMYSGSIEGNTAAGIGSRGGGVYNDSNSVFNMYGGTIKNNTANFYGSEKGDDMYIDSNASLYANAGTVAGSVVNKGTITVSDGYEGTTFGGAVTNRGTINSGTFGGTLTSYGTVNGGTFNGNVTNNGTINGGTFSKTVTNKKTIVGGTFSGSVINDGTVNGVTFQGTVTNNGTINDATFQSTVTNNGVLTFKDDNAYNDNKEAISGTGYVKVGSGNEAKYYLCDGTQLYGVAVTLTEDKVTAWLDDNSTATLVVASYTDKALKTVKTLAITSKLYEKTFAEIGLDTTDADTIKAFLLTNTETLIPMCEAQKVEMNR